MPAKTKVVKQAKPKEKKFATKCLLVKTPDQRCFFTEEKNFPVLIEFGRTFDAEISVVSLNAEVEVLDLDDLAKSICGTDPKDHPEYNVVEVKLAAPIKKTLETRAAKVTQGKTIADYIRQELTAGREMSIAHLEAKFPEVNKPCLSNYFTRTRREMTSQGHRLTRDKQGVWKIQNVADFLSQLES